VHCALPPSYLLQRFGKKWHWKPVSYSGAAAPDWALLLHPATYAIWHANNCLHNFHAGPQAEDPRRRLRV
jgi:hypothetical protein